MEKIFFKYLIIALAISAALTSCSEKEDEMSVLGKKFANEACDCFKIDDPDDGEECMVKLREKYGKYFDNEDFVIATNRAPDCEEPIWWDGGGDLKIKLLDTMIDEDGDYFEFDYDSQNRITKISRYYDGELYRTETITYGANELKVITSWADDPEDTYEEVYIQNGNTITIDSDDNDNDYQFTITVNNNGYISKIEEIGTDWSGEIIFQYQGGNLIELKELYIEIENGEETRHEDISEFKYDIKKSPLYFCKTPKWFLLLRFFDYGIGITNNLVSEEGWATYTYLYDSDGYPTKQTRKYGEEGEYTSIMEFTYKEPL